MYSSINENICFIVSLSILWKKPQSCKIYILYFHSYPDFNISFLKRLISLGIMSAIQRELLLRNCSQFWNFESFEFTFRTSEKRRFDCKSDCYLYHGAPCNVPCKIFHLSAFLTNSVRFVYTKSINYIGIVSAILNTTMQPIQHAMYRSILDKNNSNEGLIFVL